MENHSYQSFFVMMKQHVVIVVIVDLEIVIVVVVGRIFVVKLVEK